jgi:hypothetical protein
MWLNASLEKKWGELFGYGGQDKVVILNPGKRKRFTEHEGEIKKRINWRHIGRNKWRKCKI